MTTHLLFTTYSDHRDLHSFPTRRSSDLALFKESFSDLKTIERLLPSWFKFWKSDDYPSIRVTVVFANDKRWVASSDSYYPFMLPWGVSLNGTEQTTYNADISRAIAALMPNRSLNRNRLRY